MVLPTVLSVGYFLLAESLPAGVQRTLYGTSKLVMVVPALWLYFVERWRLRLLRPRSEELLVGTAFGLAVGGLMIGLYFGWLGPAGAFQQASVAIREKVSGFGLGSPVKFALFALVISVIHSFLEEYYWRGFVFAKLGLFTPALLAGTISSLAFTGHHVVILGRYFGWGSAFQILFALGVLAGGGIWCWMLQRWGTLYAPWLSHMWIDLAIFVIGYHLCFAG